MAFLCGSISDSLIFAEVGKIQDFDESFYRTRAELLSTACGFPNVRLLQLRDVRICCMTQMALSCFVHRLAFSPLTGYFPLTWRVPMGKDLGVP